MLALGLTGGIGSGKSTVALLLAERGAMIIDADVVAREVMAPGTDICDTVVDRFGPSITDGDGSIDRRALAVLVFGDEAARNDLNAIVHPAVHARVLARLAAIGGGYPDAVVILDIPLLAEVGKSRYPLAGVLVVDTPVEMAIARLVSGRGFTEEQATARVAVQASRQERRAIADQVVDNSGDLSRLDAEIDRVWAWIQALVVTATS